MAGASGSWGPPTYPQRLAAERKEELAKYSQKRDPFGTAVEGYRGGVDPFAFDEPAEDLPEVFPRAELPGTEIWKRASDAAGLTMAPKTPIAKTNAPATDLRRVGPGVAIGASAAGAGIQPLVFSEGVDTPETHVRATMSAAPAGEIPAWMRQGQGQGRASFTRPLDELPRDSMGNVRARSLGEIDSAQSAKDSLDSAYGFRGYPGANVGAQRAAELGGLEFDAQRGMARARAKDPIGYEGSQTAAEIKAALGMTKEEFAQQLVDASRASARAEGRPFNEREARFLANAAWLDFYGEFVRNKAGRYVDPRFTPLDTVEGMGSLNPVQSRTQP